MRDDPLVCTVRMGIQEDLEAVFGLVKELAIYEDGLSQVQTNPQQMKEDGFGDRPVFGFLVALVDEKIVGSAIYYYRYSTWKGKRLWLEDLIVSEEFRGKSVGTKLFEAMIDLGKKENCTGMMWQVLDWNEPAINFYNKFNASFDEEWINCFIDFEE